VPELCVLPALGWVNIDSPINPVAFYLVEDHTFGSVFGNEDGVPEVECGAGYLTRDDAGMPDPTYRRWAGCLLLLMDTGAGGDLALATAGLQIAYNASFPCAWRRFPWLGLVPTAGGTYPPWGETDRSRSRFVLIN